MTPSPGKQNRYAVLLTHVFLANYQEGADRVFFRREEIETAADQLRIKLPKNIGDVLYSFRYRVDLPSDIANRAPQGKVWIIEGLGRSAYAFVAVDPEASTIFPNAQLAETKVPRATPGIIELYALSDEQALLAILRYNRLIDIFTGVTCYSLQNHLRTQVVGVGQVETDEIYVGMDKRGAHYVFPVQAKGGTDTINVVQIKQDFAMCDAKFPQAVCRPIAAQFMGDDLIALFEFERSGADIRLSIERHYRLVSPEALDVQELLMYRHRTE